MSLLISNPDKTSRVNSLFLATEVRKNLYIWCEIPVCYFVIIFFSICCSGRISIMTGNESVLELDQLFLLPCIHLDTGLSLGYISELTLQFF